MSDQITKLCPKCQATKPTEEFTRHKNQKDGLGFRPNLPKEPS